MTHSLSLNFSSSFNVDMACRYATYNNKQGSFSIMADEIGKLRKMVDTMAATFDDVTGNAAYSSAPSSAPMWPPHTKNPTAVQLQGESERSFI